MNAASRPLGLLAPRNSRPLRELLTKAHLLFWGLWHTVEKNQQLVVTSTKPRVHAVLGDLLYWGQPSLRAYLTLFGARGEKGYCEPACHELSADWEGSAVRGLQVCDRQAHRSVATFGLRSRSRRYKAFRANTVVLGRLYQKSIKKVRLSFLDPGFDVYRIYRRQPPGSHEAAFTGGHEHDLFGSIPWTWKRQCYKSVDRLTDQMS